MVVNVLIKELTCMTFWLQLYANVHAHVCTCRFAVCLTERHIVLIALHVQQGRFRRFTIALRRLAFSLVLDTSSKRRGFARRQARVIPATRPQSQLLYCVGCGPLVRLRHRPSLPLRSGQAVVEELSCTLEGAC